jgi:hypothetical protein
MEKKIRRLIVLVLNDPCSLVPRELVNVVDLPPIPKPRESEIKYLVSCISRLVDACALTFSIKMSERPSQTRKRFSLEGESVLAGLVYLGLVRLLEKSVKTFCCWPMARSLGEQLPPEQKGVHYTFLFGKGLRGFLVARIPQGAPGRALREKVVKLANSVLCLKDSMVDVPESFIRDSFESYQNTLSSPPESTLERMQTWGEGLGLDPDSLLERFDSVQERIHESIRRTVREVFSPVHRDRFRDDDVIPSCSSSYQSSRAKGGAWQELVDQGQSLGLPSDEILLKMAYMPKTGVVSLYGRPCPLQGEWVTDGRKVRARVVPVKEPCKVRWVSIGESKAYYRAKAWNRLVYQQMPDHPTFALTGRPLTEEDVNRMKFRYLLSGDYKGATDTLDPYWSEVVFEEITKRIYGYGNWATRVLGLKGMLTGHVLEYREPGGETVEFEQANGQLMGSYLSFPVLCVLNAAINRCFLDPDLRVPISELPILINGDDIMMSSNQDFSGWARHVGLVGLRPSLGKNYVHTHVCCLNSEFYFRKTLDSDFKRVYPWRVNLCYAQDSDADGGLFGLAVNRPDFLQNASLGAMSRFLVKGHPEVEQDLLLSKFIKENFETLERSRRSWWIPEQLGGLGLPLNSRTIGKVTPFARLVASYLLTRPEPEDVLLYAPRGSSCYTESCRKWMGACNKLLPLLGFEYRWRREDEPFGADPPLPLKEFIGYGSVPQNPSYTCRYMQLCKKVRSAQNFLTPCSDETLMSHYMEPRSADWFRSSVDSGSDPDSDKIVSLPPGHVPLSSERKGVGML